MTSDMGTKFRPSDTQHLKPFNRSVLQFFALHPLTLLVHQTLLVLIVHMRTNLLLFTGVVIILYNFVLHKYVYRIIAHSNNLDEIIVGKTVTFYTIILVCASVGPLGYTETLP